MKKIQRTTATRKVPLLSPTATSSTKSLHFSKYQTESQKLAHALKDPPKKPLLEILKSFKEDNHGTILSRNPPCQLITYHSSTKSRSDLTFSHTFNDTAKGTYFTPLEMGPENSTKGFRKVNLGYTSAFGKTLTLKRQLITEMIKTYVTAVPQTESRTGYSIEEIMKHVDIYTDQQGKYIVKPKGVQTISSLPQKMEPQSTKIEIPKPVIVEKVEAKTSGPGKLPTSEKPAKPHKKPKVRTVKLATERKGEFDIKKLESAEAHKILEEWGNSAGEEAKYATHPVNVAIRLINSFTGAAFRNKDATGKAAKIAKFFGLGVTGGQLSAGLSKQKDIATSVKDKLLKILYAVLNHHNGLEPVGHSKSLPKIYIGQGNNSALVKSVLKHRPWWSSAKKREIPDCAFIWTQWRKNTVYELLLKGRALHEPVVQIYNHIEFNHQLSNKKMLYRNLKKYYESRGEDPFESVPLTYNVEGFGDQTEYCNFVVKYNELKASSDASNVWIIKPGEYTNRGNGIRVSKELSEITEILRSDPTKSFIIQKYIDRPLLINRRKFDIRCYALVTVYNDSLTGYFYEEGYLRTSCCEYSLKSLDNRLVHLTNDAIQIKSDDYGKFEPGNKLSYAEFQKYLESTFPTTEISFKRDILPRIKKIITDTVRATYTKVYAKTGVRTMELFGYDFMLDDDFKVYLIEANTNPCLELTSPLLARVIPALLDNVFR